MNDLFIKVEPSLDEIRTVKNLAVLTLSDKDYIALNLCLTAKRWIDAYVIAESVMKISHTQTTFELENKLFEMYIKYGTKTKLQQT